MFKPSPMKPMIRKENEKEKEQKIHVYIRTRPLNADEKRDRNGLMCLSVGANSKEVTIRTGASRTFVFDKVFGPDSSQMDIYKETVMGVLDEVLQGYNCTIFAYGQTGSGKTYTMEGQRSTGGSNWQDDPLAGIIPRTLHHLFDRLVDSNTEYTVRISYVELYNEELFDLLTGAEDTTRLRIYDDPMRKGSVIINGLSEVIVHNREEVYSILERGRTKRVTAATLLNANSSRSHSVFSITIHMRENTIDGEELLKIGKMYLVDLAGSENVGKSGAVDIRLREAGQINQSLLTLGRVITALTEHCPHVPYRESKLTRILQDSLGGRTKTSIIATVSPAFCNAEETLNTLDYASRAKNILNRPEINQRMTKKALLKEYTEEIEKLRKDLHAAREKHGIYIDTENYTAMTDQITAQEQTIQDISAKLEHITDQLTQQIALFESSQQRLEETEGHLCRTRNKLDAAHQKLLVDRENLQQTTTEREQLRYISEVYAENENVLYSQARELLRSCESLMQDLHQMHEHAERQRQREERNKAALEEHAASVPVLTEEMQTGVAGECRESSRLCVEETRQIEKLATEILPKLLSNYDSTTTSTSNAMGELTHATHSKIESLCAQLMEAVKTGRVNQENVGTTMNAFCATETEAHAALSQTHEGTDHSIAKLNAKLVKDIGDQTHQLSSHVGHATNNHSALLVECQGAAQTHAERQNGKISAVCQRLDDMEAQMQKALASIQTVREEVKQIAVDTATNYENIESSTTDAVTSASELQDHIQTSLQKVSDVATTYGEDAERLLGKSRKKTKKALGEADARLEKLSSETQANTTMVLELFDTISDRTNELNVTSEQGMNKTNATFVNHVTALRACLSGSIEEATKRMDVQRQHIAQLEQHLQQLSGVVDEGTLALNQEVQNLLQEKYSFDKPSGKTPKRAPDASYPRKLKRTEAPEVLVDRFKETFVPSAVTTSFLEDSMMTSPARSNLSADSLDSGSSTSTLNANKENSEAPIRLRVEQIEKSKSRSKENIVAAVSSASSQEDLVQKGDSKLLKPKATGRGRKPARELGNKN